MSLVVDEHRQYLSDPARISIFQQALTKTVKPGDVVLDLGAGTGILGLLACRAGASRVYAVDEGGIIELARQVARANGFQDRITFLKGFSTQLELPEKVDVVVADQIGQFGFEAGVVEYYTDARRRFLKPGGAMIPSRIDLVVAAVECPKTWEQVEFWDQIRYGLDFRPARARAVNTGYPVHFSAEHLLGDPVALASFDPSLTDSETLHGTACLMAKRCGALHGIGGWFIAQLAPGVTMTNSPLAEAPINRRNVFFPIDRPLPVAAGDQVRVTMGIRTIEVVVGWEVEARVETGGKARFRHSTFEGMLMCREDLQRSRPESVPELTPWGAARLSVLRLCDGRRSLAEIEREVYRSHPQLFRSIGQAARFVAEVVTRYSR